jgi:hypothetical protein
VPNNVNRCDGLWVEAEGTPGFIITKVQLIIRDCNGVEVLRTKFGKSKVKDYKNAYYECVREAFEEIRNSKIQQKEIDGPENILTLKTSETPVKVVVTTPAAKSNPVVFEKPMTTLTGEVPTDKYTNYSNSGNSYLLRKTSKGFNLYQEYENLDDDLQLIGKLSVTPKRINFIDLNSKVYIARFDASGNLIIEEENKEVVYKIEN